MDSTGKRIKGERGKMRYSQEELAQMMGKTSKQVISNWENDKNEPTLSDLKKLAIVLETSVAYLVGEAEIQAPTDPNTITISKDEFIELQRKALHREEEKNKKLENEVQQLKNG